MAQINIQTSLFKTYDIVINDKINQHIIDKNISLTIPNNQPQTLQVKHRYFKSNEIDIINDDIINVTCNPLVIIITFIVCALIYLNIIFIPILPVLLPLYINNFLKLTKNKEPIIE